MYITSLASFINYFVFLVSFASCDMDIIESSDKQNPDDNVDEQGISGADIFVPKFPVLCDWFDNPVSPEHKFCDFIVAEESEFRYKKNK